MCFCQLCCVRYAIFVESHGAKHISLAEQPVDSVQETQRKNASAPLRSRIHGCGRRQHVHMNRHRLVRVVAHVGALQPSSERIVTVSSVDLRTMNNFSLRGTWLRRQVLPTGRHDNADHRPVPDAFRRVGWDGWYS